MDIYSNVDFSSFQHNDRRFVIIVLDGTGGGGGGGGDGGGEVCQVVAVLPLLLQLLQ